MNNLNLTENNKERYQYCEKLIIQIVSRSIYEKYLKQITDAMALNKTIVLFCDHNLLKKGFTNLITLHAMGDKLYTLFCQNVDVSSGLFKYEKKQLVKSVDNMDKVFLDGFETLPVENQKNFVEMLSSKLIVGCVNNVDTSLLTNYQVIDLTEFNGIDDEK